MIFSSLPEAAIINNLTYLMQNKIILGVFGDSYRALKAKYKLKSFAQFDGEVYKTNHEGDSYVITSHVFVELLRCTRCYFDLTMIEERLDDTWEERISLQELYLVLTTPEFLKKTRFYKYGCRVKTEKVFNWFIFNKYWDTTK